MSYVITSWLIVLTWTFRRLSVHSVFPSCVPPYHWYLRPNLSCCSTWPTTCILNTIWSDIPTARFVIKRYHTYNTNSHSSSVILMSAVSFGPAVTPSNLAASGTSKVAWKSSTHSQRSSSSISGILSMTVVWPTGKSNTNEPPIKSLEAVECEG